MAATPSSAAALSPPSSPVAPDKSFMTNVTEDEDTKMMDATPEPSEKQPRGRGKGARESLAQGSMIGKIRHLKKEDGEPLWRKDIQYDFLKAVFDNEEKVFTNSYDDTMEKQCFADLYIDTMSRSSKTSKVLRDKLLSDRDAAKGMAMVCLLVNIGRMNTTLNFFPEMRAQLRTYHAIPSLQAHQDAHAYKQLQDAPRLKSILKGGAEDRSEPNSLDKIKSLNVPRTNPVNMLFVICQAAAKIAELHFPPGREFHDLIMKTNFTSKSRAAAFLWVMWFYLESDFTEEGCEENPFGPGVDYGVDVANQGVPELIEMDPAEEAEENVDPEEEVAFGYEKQKMRAKIIAADQQYVSESQPKRGSRAPRSSAVGEDGPGSAILPRIRPSKHESDIDSSRSTPPPRALARTLGGGSSRRSGPLKYHHMFDGSSPGGPTPSGSVPSRKPRPPTAHQIAVEENRNQRVEYILDRGVRKKHHQARKSRRAEGAIIRAYNRLQEMQDPFEDSEGEDSILWNNTRLLMGIGAPRANETGGPFRDRGHGGLCLLVTEEDDFGEEVSTYAASIRRLSRRLKRWDGSDLGVVPPVKRPRPPRPAKDPNETEEEDMMDLEASQVEVPQPKTKRPWGGARANSGGGGRHGRSFKKNKRAAVVEATSAAAAAAAAAAEDEAEILDDVDKELLGMASDREGEKDGEDEDGDDLDDVDKTLLGMGDGSDTE
ncbi:uncharacterized protein E0L32_012032 [Thyridium curvatum]|uniref:Ino eighty subunit 1 n=1 Tax=Thyridium curvatum TaxID=1093900 RepID=A0A507BDV0_9PEZI|nr:uncharacterized protein E0L32_012032 [Thyridium curvatum]TPX17653.1 hypothetical protein E0L32_012032 [Thyridium curvatum]